MSQKVLSPEDLKTYLKNVKDLEFACYQQNIILSRLKATPDMVQRSNNQLLAKSQELLKTAEKERKDVENNTPIDDFFTGLFGGVMYSYYAAFAGVFIWFVCRLFGLKVPFLKTVLFVTGAWLVVCTIGVTKDGIKTSKEKSKALPSRLKELYRQNSETLAIIENRKNQLSTAIPASIQEAEKNYQASKAALQAYYDMDIIYPKYRSLVPVTTIYEYIESGRCTTLEGYEGAYNLFESELRMNRIIGKLDEINEKLDIIAENQMLLAEEIGETNRIVNNISQSVLTSLNKLDAIEEYSELTAYYSRTTAMSTSYVAWLNFLKN